MSRFDEDLLHSFSSACIKLRSGGAGVSSLHTDVFDLLRRPGVWVLSAQILEEGVQGSRTDTSSGKLLDSVSADDKVYFIFLAAKVLHTLIAKRWAHCQQEQRAYVRNTIFTAVLRNSFGLSSPISRMLQRSMALLLLTLPSHTLEDMQLQHEIYAAFVSLIKSRDIDSLCTVLRVLGEVGEELKNCEPDKFRQYNTIWSRYRSLLISIVSFCCLELQSSIKSQSGGTINTALKTLSASVSSLLLWCEHDAEMTEDADRYEDPFDGEESVEESEQDDEGNQAFAISQSALLSIDDLLSISDTSSEIGIIFQDLFGPYNLMQPEVFLDLLKLLFRLPNSISYGFEIVQIASEMLQVLAAAIQCPSANPSYVLKAIVSIVRCWEILTDCSISSFLEAIGIWSFGKHSVMAHEVNFPSGIKCHLASLHILWNYNSQDDIEESRECSSVLILLIELSITICERFGDLLFGSDAYNSLRTQVFANEGFAFSGVLDVKAIGRRVWSALISYVCVVPDVSSALMATEILSNARDYAPSGYFSPCNSCADESRLFSASAILLMTEHMRFPLCTNLLSASRTAVIGATERCKSEKHALLANGSLEVLLECRRESHLVISSAWKTWSWGRPSLIQEFEAAIADIRTLNTLLEAALTSQSEILSFVNVRCDRLPHALFDFARVLFQLETRLQCMAWIGEVLVENHDIEIESNSKATFVSAKKMHTQERKVDHISSDALSWLRTSILVTGEIANLHALLDQHKSKCVYSDFNTALALVRYSFAELWIPLSSMVKKYCSLTDNEAEIALLRERAFQAIDIFLRNSDLRSVSTVLPSLIGSSGNLEVWMARIDVTILDMSLTALEALLMSFAGSQEESLDAEDADDLNDAQQMEWLSSPRNILASQDAVFMVLQKIVQQSPLLKIASTLSSLSDNGIIATGDFSLKQFKSISRKFGNCCGRLLSIVLSQASTLYNQDALITSPAWLLAVQLSDAQFNCFASELRSVKCSIGRLVSSSDNHVSFSSASESILTTDALDSFLLIARTDPGAVARVALMCSVVAWGSRCVLSHIGGFLFGLATSNPGRSFLAQHFRCDLFQKLVFCTGAEELCNCSRLVAFVSMVSSSVFSFPRSRHIISFLGSLEGLYSDVLSLAFDTVQLVEDLEILTKRVLWTNEFTINALNHLFMFFESLSIQSKYWTSLFSVLAASPDLIPQALIVGNLFPLPVLHLISSYAIQIQRSETSANGMWSQKIIELAVNFVHKISESYNIIIATGGSFAFKIPDIDAIGLSSLKLSIHIFRLTARDSWIYSCNVSKSIAKDAGIGYESTNLVRLLCDVCSQMVMNECTRKFESKGSHAHSLKVIQAISSAIRAISRDIASVRDSAASTASAFEQEWVRSISELITSILYMLLICKEGRASRGNAGIQMMDVVLHSLVDQNTCPSGLAAADHAIRHASARLGNYFHPSFKTEVTVLGVVHQMSVVHVLDIIRASIFKYCFLLSSTGSGLQPMRLSTIIESLSQLVANVPLDGKNRLVEWATEPATPA